MTKVDCLEKIYEALGGEHEIKCDAGICDVLDKIAEAIPNGFKIKRVGGNNVTVDIRTLDTGLYIIEQGSKYQTKDDGTTVNITIDMFMFVTTYYGAKSTFMINTSGYQMRFHSFGADPRQYFMGDVITKNNEIHYIPTQDYHPTTKKYVDEAIVALRNELNGGD